MAFSLRRPLIVFIVATIWSAVSLLLAISAAAAPPSEAPGSSPSPSSDGNGERQAPEPSPHGAETAPSPSTAQPSLPGPVLPPSSPGPSISPEPSGPEIAVEPPDEDEGGESPDVSPSSNHTVVWCAVRDEFADCQHYVSLLDTSTYEWSCVQKQSAMECMEAIKSKKVDLISLDAGLAYIAFSNYSMKAIMAEEYCYHGRSYEAVAVVNKANCDENSRLTLGDFRGSRSCHAGYRTAAGWNFPVLYLVKSGLQAPSSDSDIQTDETVVNGFFSETCAPSEFDGSGLCNSCGNNGSCDASVIDKYQGYSGAFRCLVEGVGDIAFLRSDTVPRLSNDGLNAQNWSTKSVDDFMYLCPNQGCKPISDNVGDCKFASVPANVIMTFNSQSNSKKSAIVRALLNASWTDFFYSGRNPHDHILSASTQSLVELYQVTRAYLGESATIAEIMNSLESVNVDVLPPNSGGYQRRRSVSICSIISVMIAFFSAVFL